MFVLGLLVVGVRQQHDGYEYELMFVAGDHDASL